MLAAPVAAVDSGGIGGKPANPRADNPRTQSIFVYELKPGARTSDAVKVINNTESTKTLLVYAVDSQVSSGGAFACAQKVDTPVSVGSWIKLAKQEVTLKPNSSENVGFVLNVPKTASAGESNGCIVIQDAQQVPVQQGDGITLSFRTALRVAVTVPGKITKGLSFTNLVVTNPQPGTLRMTTGLKNGGNVSLDTNLDVRVKTLFGTTAQRAGGQYPVLANSEASFNFEVPKSFWGGWYMAQAKASFNPDLASSLGEAGSTKTINSQAVRFFIAPKPLALAIELVGLALIAGATLYILRLRRKLRKLHASSKVFVVEKGDTLQSLAEEYHVSWKDIARLNKLKPPYHLKPKDRIKIPLK
jgi:LysM repeat protein